MSSHSFHDLFAQLGLDADLGSIQAFIGTHAPPRPDCCTKP
jgi:hypothetical protein